MCIRDSASVVAQIKEDLHRHRVLIFRDQGQVEPETQLEVSRWFGEVESTFYKHPQSPHPDIFRVSNDEDQGCRNVGRSGWHIDGSFMQRPFKVQTMHFWAVNNGGSTLFAPLNETIGSLDPERQQLWNKLWFVTEGGIVHPLVYPHPVSQQPTLCFHCGPHFVKTFAVDYDRESHKAGSVLPPEQVRGVIRELGEQLQRNAYAHQWELGDFAIIDNLAVGHYAHPDTQASVESSGLRILHRTTVSGDNVPDKHTADDE
eukprot:TRINITY_DN7522_c0_g1_i2.p1 TRINITY_DN7522_c0_g1~~TRINITY_DN7522_c0_g1_i2.p1  ORF type:complete len:259 (+),score=58.68 TRINITY_DN7522_c0_g1_i2:72-848(+)